MNSTVSSWAVICSPVSGAKKGQEVVESVLMPEWKKILPNVKLSIYYTQHAGNAVELAQEIGKDGRGVIIVGGDGTVHEVIEGLSSIGSLRSTPLAILSQGTMNFYATSAGLPSAKELPSVIATNKYRPSPLMKINDNTGILDR